MAFSHSRLVRFADVDHAGIVYYPVFVDWMHQTFEELLSDKFGRGWYAALLSERRLGFPTVQIGGDYRNPVRFGDEVTIALTVARIGERSIRMLYRMTRSDGELAFEGHNVCVAVDLDSFASVVIPPDLRRFFETV